MSDLIGKQVGVYEIVSLLGAGGMGEVYRARDTKLGRDVAIKVLPAAFVEDPDRLTRFEREARVLASLNHPHIATIHGLEDADGVHAIVLELIEGETLAERLHRVASGFSRTGLALNEAVAIARQIADALEAAHEKGIVHRDLKPANIQITPGGVVKVLDFGLAKVGPSKAGPGDAGAERASLSQSPTIGATRGGVWLGTAAYMSPEQARGLAVDARTDIWAFGCVLYEMLVGRVVFSGATISDHIAAILKTDPDWAALPPETPEGIRRLLRHCLQKDPKDRLRDIADAKIEFDDGSAARLAAVGSGWTRSVSLALGGVGIVLAGAVLAYVMSAGRDRSASAPRLTNPVQIAGSIGEERLPSWSPDGRMIAYQSDQAGNNDIWIAQVGSAAVNRTADFLGGDEAPRFSPDGRQIAFWSAREGGGVFLMPTLSGGARKIGPARPDVAAAAAWSPDGTQIAYPVVGPVAGGQPRLEILNLQSGAIRQVATGLGPTQTPNNCLDLAWSPDGRFLACVQANSYNNQTAKIWTLRLADGKFTAITDFQLVNWSANWSPDSRTLFFTSNRGVTMDLWQQRIGESGEPVGEPVRLTAGLDVLQAAFTTDGTRVAYSKGRRIANVWRVPILTDRLATWADAQQLTFDQAWIEAVDVSPDGQRLAIQSDRGGNADIWLLPSAGGEMMQLTSDPAPDWWPAWSPDGREVAFYSNRVGDRETWVQPIAGGPARQLTHGGGLFPRWSRDGREILAQRQNGGVSVVSAAGGEPRPVVQSDPGRGLTNISTMEFALAPDGRSFAFAAGRAPDRRLWTRAFAGDDVRPFTQGQAAAPSWSRDGEWIFFTTFRDSGGVTYQLERPGLNIWRISRDGKRELPLTRLVGRRGYLGQNLANDGRYVYFTWREDVADIWMMDIVRP